jgi:hypothetical protein
MQRRVLRGWSLGPLLFVILGAACSEAEAPATPCVGGSPSCGGACNAAHPCPAGLFCGRDQLCGKQCDATHACPAGGSCSSTGQCSGAGRAVAAGTGGSGGKRGSAATSGGSARPDFGDSGLVLPDASNQAFDADSGVCARSDVVAGRVTPTVMLIIDQSSSMNESFDNGSRWNVLRDFLLKDDGLIKSLEAQVRFGIAMYSARSEPVNGVPAECPLVTSVNPALNNFGAIQASYRAAEPIDDTPTGDSIDAVVSGLPQPAPDAVLDPVVLILATDGEPDRCEQLDPQDGHMETINAVTNAFNMHIKTFVIGVGDEISMQHQQDVANAGLGHKPGEPNAPYWVAGDDQSLRAALMEIIGAQVSCEIKLKGKVEGDQCLGEVTLNGSTLGCNDKDGWELVNTSQIRLLGKACDELKKQQTALLRVSFPCGVVLLE